MSADEDNFTLRAVLGYTVADKMRTLADRLENATDERGRLVLSPEAAGLLVAQIRTGADYVEALRTELKAQEDLIKEGTDLLKGLLK